MTQAIETTTAKEAANKINQMLKVNDIEVNTVEDAFHELARRTNLDKNVTLNTLLGRDKFHNKDAFKAKSLSNLFTTYFRGVVDPVYLQEDLKDLNKLLNVESEDAVFAPTIKDSHKIKKGMFLDNHAALFVDGFNSEKKRQVMIGSSRRDCAVYFVFVNDKRDVNNGVIYVRNSPLSRLRRVNTFEINPFAIGQGIVTDEETGETSVKSQLTFNPGWLANTVDNMEKYVFAPLVYVPPKMPKLKKQKGITEVDMNSLIEKTLAKVKVDPAKAGEEFAEEVRTGIEGYQATALAEIAKRDEKEPNETTQAAMGESREIIENESARFDSPEKLFEALGDKTTVLEDVDYVYPTNPAVFDLQRVPNDDPNGLTNQQLLALVPNSDQKSTLGQKPSTLDTETGGLDKLTQYESDRKAAHEIEAAAIAGRFPQDDLDSGCMGFASGKD